MLAPLHDGFNIITNIKANYPPTKESTEQSHQEALPFCHTQHERNDRKKLQRVFKISVHVSKKLAFKNKCFHYAAKINKYKVLKLYIYI